MSADEIARKAANFASRLDFWLLASTNPNLPTEKRQEAMLRSFKQFAGLLEQMRGLKAAYPALYAKAEAEALSAREIEGKP